MVDGGTGPKTFDSFAWYDGTATNVYMPNTPSGTDCVGSPGPCRTFTWAGMDTVIVLAGDDIKRQILGSVFADKIELSASPTPGMMRVTFVGTNWFNGTLHTSQSTFDFLNPSKWLRIEAGSGGDTIWVKSIDAGFNSANGDGVTLGIYGNRCGSKDREVCEAPTIEPDAGRDTVIFDTSVSTHGAYLEVFADTIKVEANVHLSTTTDDCQRAHLELCDLAAANDITFRARRVGTPDIENLMPAGYLLKETDITIGANALITATSVFLISQAEDRSLAEALGITTLGAQAALAIPNLLTDILALPVKVLVKKSKATVTIGDDAQILTDYMVGIYATAVSDASGSASSQLFSLGFAWAEGEARITIGNRARIEGRNGPVNISSDATATAAMATETSREEQGEVPGRRGAAFAASLAVTYAKVTSQTWVKEGASILGGRTVNVRALGTAESEAEAESGLFADGTAAVALALEFSTADNLARVDGTVQANMDTPGGEVVKFEFDPTVKAANYNSGLSSLTGLVGRVQCPTADDLTSYNCIPSVPDYVRMGDTVVLAADLPVGPSDPLTWNKLKMGKGTVLEYVGPRLTGTVSLSPTVQAYRNPALWRVTSEPWGYVDTVNDRIAVYNLDNEAGNWVVVSEDTVDYSPRRGETIGGLPPGTYLVIGLEDDEATATDESRYIKLARNEQQAIEGKGVDLMPGATVNTRKFDAGDIKDDTISFHGVANNMELGQAAYYREPGHTDFDRVVEDAAGNLIWRSPDPTLDGTPYVPMIEGLNHGDLVYIMTGTDQFNLIGDQRLVDGQDVQLGALENETRGGIARIKFRINPDYHGTQAMKGFTLRPTQILDSTFLTFGIGSALNASDSASATAGLAKEDPDAVEKPSKLPFDPGKSAFDNIFDKLMANYKPAAGGANATPAKGADGKPAIQLAGAFAFSFTDHNVRTWITNTADMNSNDDMELTSGIVEELSLRAESTGEAQNGKLNKTTGKRAPNTSADTSVSLAIAIGVMNNTSRAIIGCTGQIGDDFYCAAQNERPHLDSMRALRLLSGTTYPFLTRPDEFFPSSLSDLTGRILNDGVDFFNNYLDGTLGLSSMFNTFTRATTSAEKLALAGSISVLVFNNTAESIVHSGAVSTRTRSTGRRSSSTTTPTTTTRRTTTTPPTAATRTTSTSTWSRSRRRTTCR